MKLKFKLSKIKLSNKIKWSNSRKSASVKTNKESLETNVKSGSENNAYSPDEPRMASEWVGGAVGRPEGECGGGAC